jgi:hypothetical protein
MYRRKLEEHNTAPFQCFLGVSPPARNKPRKSTGHRLLVPAATGNSIHG